MNFEDIRPYYDSEYQGVVQKLLQQAGFVGALRLYFPEIPEDRMKALLLACPGIQGFQQTVISPVIERIIAQSMTALTVEGLEGLDPSRAYLFMSNHRDIVLDSAFINYSLNKAGFATSEIAIGSNLLEIEWIRDLVRINKSFIVKRNLPLQEMLEASKTLSAYINHAVTEKGASVWIAQREGRAKDGNDRTNPGLLKMFGLGTDKNLLQHLIDLNIIPVSISYEYDPCDQLKIPELAAKSRGQSYTKKPGEDLQHMLFGIQGAKGRVQLNFGQPIAEKLAALTDVRNRNEQLRQAALIIDQQIQENYHLWPSNYVAADLLAGNNRFSDHYTAAEQETFSAYMSKRLQDFSEEPEAQRLFLEMYANPVLNSLSWSA